MFTRPLRVFLVLAAALLIVPAYAQFGGPVPIRRAQPAQPVRAAGGKKAQTGLHLPPGQNVNFNWEKNDGEGFRWDIQSYGNIGQGTNYAYSGGSYSQVWGNNIYYSGKSTVGPNGDEIEIGPHNNRSLRCYRRIKIYQDRGLARWIDILENPTGQDIQVQLQVYSYINYGIGQTETSSGGTAFGGKDYGFITTPRGGNNTPSVLQLVCAPKAKLRPTVQINGNQIYVRYQLTVPANGNAVLCYFHSQNQDVGKLRKIMKDFRPYKLLKDLTPQVRKMLLNMPTGSGYGEIQLERDESSDMVILNEEDPIKGRIANENFKFDTFFGAVDVPAAQVIGMAAAKGDQGKLRALLRDGQVISGTLSADKLQLELPTGGRLQIPFDRLRQFSYRISAERPEEIPFAGPFLVLRTGDRLAFAPKSLELKLRSRHGLLNLPAESLLRIDMDNEGHSVHRVWFRNGASLGGFLEPASIKAQLTLGPETELSRNLLTRVEYAPETEERDVLTHVVLDNGDELFGQITSEKLTLVTEFGEVDLEPRNIELLEFSRQHLGRCVAKLWDETVLRGQLKNEKIAFQIVPGPRMELYPGHIAAVQRSNALPPQRIASQVEKLVLQLGSESYEEREAATKALTQMGKSVVPLLQRYLTVSDAEIRHRVETVIEKLGGKAKPPTEDDEGPLRPAFVPMRGGIRVRAGG